VGTGDALQAALRYGPLPTTTKKIRNKWLTIASDVALMENVAALIARAGELPATTCEVGTRLVMNYASTKLSELIPIEQFHITCVTATAVDALDIVLGPAAAANEVNYLARTLVGLGTPARALPSTAAATSLAWHCRGPTYLRRC
jgi:hypothetical protein